MPRIGQRMVKSAVAVFLCFLLDLARGSGIPFYSAIAAILCMQNDVPGSLTVARNRVAGTLLGGLLGMLVLFLERAFLPRDWQVAQYLLVSLCIIPLIYLTVLLHKTSAAYISCVVFLSVTISHGADVNPHLFALDRILDTLLGIFVSLLVNAVHLPGRKNNLLLLVDLDQVAKEGGFTGYCRVRLNHLAAQGAKLAFVTAGTPSGSRALLEGIEPGLPLLALGGAALYDRGRGEYLRQCPLPAAAAQEAQNLLARQEVGMFAGLVVHHQLYLYCPALENLGEQAFYRRHYRLPGQHCLCLPPPEGEERLFLLAIQPEGRARELAESLGALPRGKELAVRLSPAQEPGYLCLWMTGAQATGQAAARRLLGEWQAQELAVLSCREAQPGLMEAAAYPVELGCQGSPDSRRLEGAVNRLGRLYSRRLPPAAGKTAEPHTQRL